MTILQERIGNIAIRTNSQQTPSGVRLPDGEFFYTPIATSSKSISERVESFYVVYGAFEEGAAARTQKSGDVTSNKLPDLQELESWPALAIQIVLHRMPTIMPVAVPGAIQDVYPTVCTLPGLRRRRGVSVPRAETR